eukprot:6240368-Pyramimonas_sp.AAC.1
MLRAGAGARRAHAQAPRTASHNLTRTRRSPPPPLTPLPMAEEFRRVEDERRISDEAVRHHMAFPILGAVAVTLVVVMMTAPL